MRFSQLLLITKYYTPMANVIKLPPTTSPQIDSHRTKQNKIENGACNPCLSWHQVHCTAEGLHMTLAQPRWFVREICSLTASGCHWSLFGMGSSEFWLVIALKVLMHLQSSNMAIIDPVKGRCFSKNSVVYDKSCRSHEPKARVLCSVSSLLSVIC